MRASLSGLEELAGRVQQALALPTKKEAETVVDTVIAALEATMLNNLHTDGFTLKLSSFGKFSVLYSALKEDLPTRVAEAEHVGYGFALPKEVVPRNGLFVVSRKIPSTGILINRMTETAGV